jgi:HPt (histidine-containing phosphotransfer) domain-containing protein
MLALLKQYLRPQEPAESQGSGGSARAVEGPANPELPDVPSAQVLDSAALARLIELDPKGENQLLERVLRAFQSSVARLRPQAEAARLSDDQATLRLFAHTLKSSSASIGALRLSQLCAQVEAAIRTESGEDIESQFTRLGAELDGVLVAVENLLKDRA